MEQIEEHWREESRDLEAMVSHLQEENRKLSSLLAEKRQAEKSSDPGTVTGSQIDHKSIVFQTFFHFLEGNELFSVVSGALLSPEVDTALLQRLRALVDRLKDQLRQRDRELQSKQTEIDSVIPFLVLLHYSRKS